MTPKDDFLNVYNGRVIIKRLTSTFPVAETVVRAKSFLGEPYDWEYMPDNGKMYCSELIYEAYLNEDGSHIFSAKPMTFKNAEGETPQFWIELFKKLEVDIPEGIPGTNPNDIFNDGRLITL